MKKQELRQLYKEKRKAIPAKDKLKWDDLMLLQFQKLGFGNVNTLLSYWPMDEMGEPDTHLFSRYMRHMVPGLRVAYPVADFANIEMNAVLTNDDTDYHTGISGITEPTEGEQLDPHIIDMIFVPLLAFSQQGFRVGYGKGFYDKYLALCRKDVATIGFSYFDPVDKIDDAAQFDVPLNICITPGKTYEF